jgi:hypothetical protein
MKVSWEDVLNAALSIIEAIKILVVAHFSKK